MAKVREIYVGDLAPPLEGTCTGDGDQPQNLTGAQAIVVRLIGADGVPLIEGRGAFVRGAPTSGDWRMNWQEGDTAADNVGVYDVETTVTLADGLPMTFSGVQVVIRPRK